MPIRKHLVDKPAFSPETIAAMSKAFEGACIALRGMQATRRAARSLHRDIERGFFIVVSKLTLDH